MGVRGSRTAAPWRARVAARRRRVAGPAGTGARIEQVLRAYGLPTERDERLTRAHLAAVMALDKKAEGDGVRCVLLTKIGACTGTVIRGAQLEALL